MYIYCSILSATLEPYRAGVNRIVEVVRNSGGHLRQVHCYLRCTERKTTTEVCSFKPIRGTYRYVVTTSTDQRCEEGAHVVPNIRLTFKTLLGAMMQCLTCCVEGLTLIDVSIVVVISCSCESGYG